MHYIGSETRDYQLKMTQEVNGKTYPSCMYVYDLHSFCISFRSQLNQVRRYGKMQECKDLFDGCLSATSFPAC
jgi:hypothetical protein